MERRARPKLSHTGYYQLEILEEDDLKRNEVEDFIYNCFALAYKANIKTFLPNIMSLRNEAGQISSALGYKKAGVDKLFLESYLDDPAESYLERIFGCSVRREDIIEVGNLASASSGGSRLLITALCGLLQGKGAKWVVFTATPALLNSFSRMGLPPYALSLADKAALGEGSGDWGSYYEQAPVVVAGNVSQGFLALQKKLRLKQIDSQYNRLSQDAYSTGLSRATNNGC